MRKFLEKYDHLFVFLLGCLWAIIIFSPFVFSPNEFLFSSGGDGLKNYFTYLYQVKYGSGIHFEGMNYPHGEHVVFTDNMPGLVWLIQFVSIFFPDFKDWSLGIVHLLLILAIPLAILYLYKIFRHWKLPRIWACIASMIIVSSCQQYIKIEGHFGMAFMCYLPMLLYWLMRFHSQGSKKYLWYYALLSLVFSFLHVYNLAFSMVLMIAYSVSFLLIAYRKNGKKVVIKSLQAIGAALVPLICFQLFMAFTDEVEDRSNYPDGVFLGVSKPIHFLMNPYSPLGRVLEPLLGHAEQSLGEGAAYLGISSLILILFLLVLLLKYISTIRQGKSSLFQQIIPRGWAVWLLTTFFILLLAMGVPVSWGWTWLIDYMSALRQFRTVGRFSWLVFYLVQIFLVLVLYRFFVYLLAKDMRKIGVAVVLFCMSISAVEALTIYTFFSRHRIEKTASYKRILGHNPKFDFQAHLERQGLRAQDFQALIALPFYHVGSEKLWVGPSWNAALNQSMAVSLQTGLPIVDVMMSRTSWKQTFSTLRLVDGAFSEKPILEQFNAQPILILVDTAGLRDADELFLLQVAKPLFAYDRYEVFSLLKNDLIAHQTDLRDSVTQLIKQQVANEGIIYSDTSAFWYSNSFENGIVEGLSGKAFWRTERDDMFVFDQVELPSRNDTEFVFSLWAKVGSKDPFIPGYYIDQYDSVGHLVHQESFGAKWSTYTLGDLWLLLDKPMKIHPSARTFTIKVEDAFPGNRAYLALDQLAIYPKDAIYFRKDGNEIWINNRPQP